MPLLRHRVSGNIGMTDASKPGAGVVPSARAERRRVGRDDTSEIVLYATTVAVISVFIIAVVALA